MKSKLSSTIAVMTCSAVISFATTFVEWRENKISKLKIRFFIMDGFRMLGLSLFIGQIYGSKPL
jgi:hypothetical protein